jgi:undecaprenyl diphosphate synthase
MNSIPKHVGFIMDGNRRWAKGRGMPALEGHVHGQEALRTVSRALFEQGVEYVSAYAFSTENWQRTKEEVGFLMKLVHRAVDTYLHEFHDENIRLVVLGTREGLGEDIIASIDHAEEKTRHNTKGTLALCFNYGGQQEIVDAFKKIAATGTPHDKITAEAINEHLYAPEVPSIDIIVRTSGEQRLSNFMLWRAAYSELMFIKKYWPDMTKQDASSIIDEYSRRKRRFGA